MRLEWDADGSRLYETGTDRGAVYPFNYETSEYGIGYAWNGLTGVDESPSGGDVSDFYANNSSYIKKRGIEDFAATINAYTYPEEFELLDGQARFSDDGIKINKQPRKKFGFSYRTLIGNDVDHEDHGYRIHLIYNCIASPSTKSYETVNNDPNEVTFSWELTTSPIIYNGYKASAHVEIDSTKITPYKLQVLENMLYGTEDTDPYFPTLEDLRYLYPEVTITGTFLTFDDGAAAPARSLITDISPIQDLHGYDHAWIGGTGKNLLDPSSAVATKSGATVAYNADTGVTEVTANDITYGGAKYPSISADSENTQAYTFSLNVTEIGEDSTCKIVFRKVSDDIVVSGSVVTVDETGIFSTTIIPTEPVYVTVFCSYSTQGSGSISYTQPMLEASDTPTMYEPYENICPITGHTDAKVRRTGKNLFAVNLTNQFTNRDITYTKNADGSVMVDGTNDGTGISLYGSTFSLPAGNYLFNAGIDFAASSKMYALIWDVDAGVRVKKWDETTDSDTATDSNFHEARLEAGKTYSFRLCVRQGETVDEEVFHPMLCVADEIDENYEPNVKVDYSETFGQTIYGGTLDFVSGVLTVDKASFSVDSSKTPTGISDERIPGYTIFYMYFPSATVYPITEGVMCDSLPIESVNTFYSTAKSSISATSSYPHSLIVKLPTSMVGSTVETIKAYLTDHPIQIVAPLVNPITIKLAPQKVMTLLGMNNIWEQNSNELALIYRRDPEIE